MASPRYLTVIPTTQPSCGSITLDSPTPQCNNGSSTNEDLGCFVQSTGLYCAPLATTRGFLYTLDYNNDTATSNITSSGYSGATGTHNDLIPRLSTANQNINLGNATSNPPLGVDGQPVLHQAAAGLDQTCVGIPTPPEWDVLVAVAEKRLKEVVGSPGLGSGSDVLSLRSDCEAGTYCDFSHSSTSSQYPALRLGTCKEQFPNYHTCSSYFECISLRCDDMPIETRRLSETSDNHMRKRETGPVCLPPNYSMSGTSDGSNGSTSAGTAQSSFFPMWTIAPIAIVAIGGAVLMYVLVRRRRRYQDAQQRNRGPKVERMRERERERERTMSNNPILYQAPTATSYASSGSNHSRVILPKITTTSTGQLVVGPSTPTTSNEYASSSTSSTASSATWSPSALSAFSNSSVPLSPSSPSRLHNQSLPRSSGFSFSSGADRFQEGEIPSRSMLRVSSMCWDSTMPPSAANASGGAGVMGASTGSNTLIPAPSPTSWSPSSSALTSPTIPISPISPISPPPPYLGTNSGGSSRLASRSSYQIAGASHRRL